MAKIYTFVAAAFMASALSVAAQDYTVAISPDPTETYEALPRNFVIEFDGPTSIAKNVLVGNPLLIIAPDGTTKQQVPITTLSEKSATFNVPAAFEGVKSGTYTVELRVGGVKLVWADGTKTNCTSQTWTYTVDNGTGDGGDEDDSVKYDIEISGLQPKLNPIDIANKTLETLQIIVNCPDVRPVDGAMVTIEGPGYSCTASLLYSMGVGGTSTWLKASFNEPEYNGNYTLTIPGESMGNPAWFEDHEKGRTNDEIVYEFEVIGGKDPSEITKDTSLGITYSPALNTKLSEIEEITMTFSEDVLFDENVTVKAYCINDFSAIAYQPYGTASFERLAPNKVKVIFENGLNNKGSYKLNIPEATFYTAEFTEDPLKGKCNAEQNPIWMLLPPSATPVDVESTVPASNSKVSHFPVGYQVIVNTSDNEAVASMSFTLTQYESDNDTAAPKTLLTEETTEKNDEGAICWTSKEEVIFAKKYYYELSYTLMNADDDTIADGMIEFDGDDYVGLNELIEQGTENVIFSIQGIRINNSADHLPAGLYIINGKKVAVKR